LLDFGLSVMSEEQRRSSLRHAGAIEFMAPEQNDGMMLFQTDIYSYGIVLYELLAGQVPFPLKDNGETARNSVMIAHMEAKVPDLMALRRKNLPANWPKDQQERELQVPGWLLNMIAICLEKSPEKRYSNGMELQGAIVINSIIASRHEKADNMITILKTENEQLQAQLLRYHYEAKDTKKASVIILKPVFAGLILLLVSAVTFGGYEAYKKVGDTYLPVKDSISKSRTAILKNKHNFSKISKKLAPDTNPAINFHDNDSVKKAAPPGPKLIHKKHKKKRKKFLGLF